MLKASGALEVPENILLKQYQPNGVRKVVKWHGCSANGICRKPLLSSSDNTLALVSWARVSSRVHLYIMNSWCHLLQEADVFHGEHLALKALGWHKCWQSCPFWELQPCLHTMGWVYQLWIWYQMIPCGLVHSAHSNEVIVKCIDYK